MGKLEIKTLGNLKVTLDQSPILSQTSRRKAEALLVYLVSEPREHPRDTLATLLWDNCSQDRALSNLRVVLHTLKASLAPHLHIERQTVAFNTDAPFWFDVDVVKRACRAIITGGDAGRLDAQLAALALYEGDFLAGFYIKHARTFEMWQIHQQEHIAGLVADAYQRLITHYENVGALNKAIHVAEQMLTALPLSESGHTHLIRLLIADGRPAAARSRYDAYAAILSAEDTGTMPAVDLRAMIDDAVTVHPPSVDSQDGTLSLPGQLTAFVNRADELAQIIERLDDPSCRLLTLVGTGGAGKTRLSLQAAETYYDRYGHDTYFVPLADVPSPSFIAGTVADALKLTLSGSRTPQADVIEHLKARQLLLVLDNFEHLIDGGAEFVAALLTGAPLIKVLVTSRRRLDLLGEWVLPVDGLRVPASDRAAIEDYAAVQLFVQGARRLSPDFDLAAARSAVVRICQLVEGLPLALEMAAGWLSSMTPQAIADEIERGLPILTTSARNVPDRHKTLTVVFQHSWDLLDESERAALMRLSVLRGDFSTAAAQALTGGGGANVLKTLSDHSLLRENPDGTYSLHELLRQYAYDRLVEAGDAEVTHADHFDFYYGAITALTERVRTQKLEDSYLMTETEARIENIRSAMAWAAARERNADVVRFAVELGYYWELSCHYDEGLYWLDFALQAPQTLTDAEYTKALYYSGMLTYLQSDFDRCEALGEENLRVSRQSGDLELIVRALQMLGNVYLARNDFTRAHETMKEALTYAYEAEDERRINLMLMSLGSLCLEMGAFDEANDYNQRCLPYLREHNRQHYLATVLANMGLVYTKQGQLAEAEACLRESLDLFDLLNNRSGQALALGYMGESAEAQGDIEQARALQTRCLHLNNAINHKSGAATALFFLARLAMRAGEYERAASLLGAFAAACEAMGNPPAVSLESYEDVRAAVQAALEPTTFETAFQSGQQADEPALLESSPL